MPVSVPEYQIRCPRHQLDPMYMVGIAWHLDSAKWLHKLLFSCLLPGHLGWSCYCTVHHNTISLMPSNARVCCKLWTHKIHLKSLMMKTVALWEMHVKWIAIELWAEVPFVSYVKMHVITGPWCNSFWLSLKWVLLKLVIHSHLSAVPISKLQWHMMTSSNGNIFRVTGFLCGEFKGHKFKFKFKSSLLLHKRYILQQLLQIS